MENIWSVENFSNGALDIIDGDRGTNYPKQNEFSVEGYCLFLNAGNVTENGFNFSDCSFITREKDIALRKGKLTRGDIILTTRGTVGNVAFYNDQIPFENIRINSGMVILRANTEKLSPIYLYTFLRSNLFTNQVKALTTGSAQPQLPIRDLNRIQIPLPHFAEQESIAHILSSLDDKIELNRRMNATLEAMAQTLFRAWFVDFEPVKAKAAGLEPVGMDAETAALFPAEFEESALGPIPKGWNITSLDQIFTIHGGGTPKTSEPRYWYGDIPWYSVVDAPNEYDIFVIDTEKKITALGLQNSSTKILKGGTTIISARGTVGKLAVTAGPMTMNQSCYGLEPKDGVFFTYYSTKNAVAELQRNTHGAVFDTITQSTFKAISTIASPKDVIGRFEVSVTSLMKQIEANLRQNHTLAQIRDALLPRLISGQLRVPLSDDPT